MKRIIPFAHDLVKDYISKGSIVIDATCGNGNDSLYIAQLLYNTGHLYCFDIQQKAIDNTNHLLSSNNFNNFTMIKDSHVNFNKYIEKDVQLIIYNLGYLPNDNKKITTKFDTTIQSLKVGLEILIQNGIIILVIYPGHTEGAIEADEIEKFVSNLTVKKYDVIKYKILNADKSPYVIAIKKKR